MCGYCGFSGFENRNNRRNRTQNIKMTCGESGGNGGNFSAIPPQASLPPCCVIKNVVLIFREKGCWNGFLRTFEEG